MPPLARRNLFHDKVRLTVTLTGIVFAVVLIIVQLGLFFGFTSTTATLIDHSGADIWIGSAGIPYLEQSRPFSERKLYQVRATPGVARAEWLLADWGRWKRPDGATESPFIVGVNPDNPLGGPWNLVEGTVRDLEIADAVIVDTHYKEKLGVSRVGQIVEINDQRARVVGFTQGIRSFTTSPYVFTSFKNARNFVARGGPLRTTFILVQAQPGADVAALQKELQARLSDVDVLTGPQFARMTTFYWMFTTGAGIAVLIAAVLGLVVGVVVVAQTIYATTVDHIREFGTLKAMGASNRYIHRIIIQQSLVSALIGYALAAVVSWFVVRGSAEGGAAVLVDGRLMAAMFVTTIVMCMAAALVSVNKVNKIDPALVFKT
jgi:putative ABC transport system permease protein